MNKTEFTNITITRDVLYDLLDDEEKEIMLKSEKKETIKDLKESWKDEKEKDL